MPRDATIDLIMAGNTLRQGWRVLTVALAWPAGDPPYADGSHVTAPSIPTTPPAYNASTFNPAIWTDISGIVTEYHFTQDGTMQCGQLSLSVPLQWRQSLADVFEEDRVIVVQERYSDGTHLTGWHNRCWCFSDGYSERWVDGVLHSYTVNAKDALKLANIEVVGAGSGSLVLQADLVQVGTFGSKASLVLVNTATDAYEYAVTSDGTSAGAIHPNWAERPAPQFWVTNARDAAGSLVSDPVSISGAGVQAVFGSGLLRLGQNYAHTPSNNNGSTDFSVGLGIPSGTAPVVVAVLSRFAHPGNSAVTPALPADVVDGLTVSSSSPGSVTLSTAVQSAGLTLVLRDGSGLRYNTAATNTSTATLSLTRSDITIPTGTKVSYGDANRLRDVLVRLLLQCGYQMADANGPLYLHTPEVPIIAGAAQDIILPPQVYKDTDDLFHLGVIARLRDGGYIPPNYMIIADDAGQIYARSVIQQAIDNSATIPVSAIPLSPGLEYERSDINVKTRVIARGVQQQVQDATQAAGVTITDVSTADGGLPDPTTFEYYGSVVLQKSVRTTPTGNDYQFPLAWLTDRSRTITPDLPLLSPWAWYLIYSASAGPDMTQLINSWADRPLCEITLPTAQSVDTIELRVANSWNVSWGWGQSNRRISNSGGQRLGVDYFNEEQQAWMPLVTSIFCPADPTAVVRVAASEFDTRAAVTASRFRIICRAAFWGANGSTTWYNHFVLCVWLNAVMLWGSSEIRGIAELGNSSNYNGELAGTTWQAVRSRLRSRTYVLPEAVPWVNTQSYADWLALEWLKEKCKDLAPRKLAVIRPDVRLWDTIAFTDPLGNAASYLVVTTDHTSAISAQTGIMATNYLAPYTEG